MKSAFALLALVMAFAVGGFAQQPLSTGELRTIINCVHHDKVNLLGHEFNGGQLRVRYVWTHDYPRKDVVFFAFRNVGGNIGRVMEFVVEGKRPKRHFTMSNDANFDGRTWKITSDPLGGIGSHQLFDQQIIRLRRHDAELLLPLTDKLRGEGGCDSYVEPKLTRQNPLEIELTRPNIVDLESKVGPSQLEELPITQRVASSLTLVESLPPGHDVQVTQKCSEDGVVAFPLRGWVGYTNTGKPVSQMTIECFTNPEKPPVAFAKTDAAGRFAFPKLSPGKYYLRGSKQLSGGWVVRADDVVTVKRGSGAIACLVAEGEAELQP